MLAVSRTCWILGCEHILVISASTRRYTLTRTTVRGAVALCCMRMFGLDGGNFDTAGVEAQVIWQALSRFVGKFSRGPSSVGRFARD